MNELSTIRRIVTGEDPSGKAVVIEDRNNLDVQSHPDAGVDVLNLWAHEGTPDNSAEYADPASADLPLLPPAGGSVFRILDFAANPDGDAGMHTTPSLDYAYVIEGEIYAVFDDSETLMRAGDILIQRGNSHGWINRSTQPCRMLFVLIDAKN
ncbi:cupin domain-containing protein [Streptomyces sp. NPDC047081]|uniref:cupin domain-containing protein n=1 Tax=Streptomyces sp. NPDC047081 TaxID=3154706 RepID=UPI00340DFEC1